MKSNNHPFGRDYFEGDKSNYKKGYKNFKALWKDKLSILLKYKKGGKLLDVGCAYGFFCEFASKHFNTTGIDISEFAIKKAKSIHPQLEFHVSDIGDFDTKGKFDVITAFDVLEHTPDARESLERIDKMLNKDGILMMESPFLSPLYKNLRFLDKDETHLSVFTEHEWLDVVKERFEILEVRYGASYFGVLNEDWLPTKVPSWLKSISVLLMIVARKK